MPIAGWEGQLAVHETVRPDDIYFVTEMPLVVVRPRKDRHALCGTIPVILRIGQVQTGGPNFNMVILVGLVGSGGESGQKRIVGWLKSNATVGVAKRR